MNRDEALTLLRGGPHGIEEWNAFREHVWEIASSIRRTDLGEVRVNLSQVDLRQASLRRVNLDKITLEGASLCETDLRGAYFRGANLRRADLRRANLRNANLEAVRLEGADLRGADLSGASLTGADLRDAKLAGAVFDLTVVATDLSGVMGLEEVRHSGRSVVDVNSILAFKGDLPERFLRGCGLHNEQIEYFRGVVGSPIRFYSCFISYSHENKSFARRLYDALQGEGIRCWLDEHQLLPGDEVHEVVNKAIRLWDKVLLCCSEDSLTSWWVDNEISAAFTKEQRIMKDRKEKVLALIPLDLDGYLFSGWESGKRETVLQRLVGDFKGWGRDNAKFEREFQKLVKALRADKGAREKPPPSHL